jgi:hypothetical protein
MIILIWCQANVQRLQLLPNIVRHGSSKLSRPIVENVSQVFEFEADPLVLHNPAPLTRPVGIAYGGHPNLSLVEKLDFTNGINGKHLHCK